MIAVTIVSTLPSIQSMDDQTFNEWKRRDEEKTRVKKRRCKRQFFLTDTRKSSLGHKRGALFVPSPHTQKDQEHNNNNNDRRKIKNICESLHEVHAQSVVSLFSPSSSILASKVVMSLSLSLPTIHFLPPNLSFPPFESVVRDDQKVISG